MEVKYTKLQIEGATGLHTIRSDLTPALSKWKRRMALTN
jgi:hypothetical protein